MYIFLSNEKTVNEIIPDIDPVFPGVPIEDRYAPDFVAKLIHVPDGTEVEQNWTYDEDTQTFAPPISQGDSGYTITDADVDRAYEEGVNDAE